MIVVADDPQVKLLFNAEWTSSKVAEPSVPSSILPIRMSMYSTGLGSAWKLRVSGPDSCNIPNIPSVHIPCSAMS